MKHGSTPHLSPDGVAEVLVVQPGVQVGQAVEAGCRLLPANERLRFPGQSSLQDLRREYAFVGG